MNIEKLIREIGESIGKVFFNEKKRISEKINVEQIRSKDRFKIMFDKLFHQGDYDKAENLIFAELEKNNSPEVYEVAIEFYKALLQKSDEELNKSNFTREEIYKGLEDVQKFKVDL